MSNTKRAKIKETERPTLSPTSMPLRNDCSQATVVKGFQAQPPAHLAIFAQNPGRSRSWVVRQGELRLICEEIDGEMIIRDEEEYVRVLLGV